MGMFDTIYFYCPQCGEKISAQSKGGKCILAEYDISCVPADVASDANRHAPFVCSCGKVYEFDLPEKIKNVKLKLKYL